MTFDPDALLANLAAQDSKDSGGKLCVFFGMAAGVGKTYAMLQAARSKRQEGIDVLVGVVVTHGRRETESLIGDLPLLPLKKMAYKDTVLEEMDLEEILARRPQLVLVDELAHTNVPGSRHPKRWQDVIELLDAGIDVYTTVNVQHIESRKDRVEEIALVPVHETVPDSVLDRASQIRLIDLTPEDLLQRLKEGKVYQGDKAERASHHFFQLDRLTALRELSLRMTAEKVDQDLQDLTFVHEKGLAWKATERLMVAVSSSPFSKPLIRATRRMAVALESPWVAVFVDSGQPLSDSDRERLSKNLAFARDLGAEVISTVDTDILSGLTRVAIQKNVSQVVVGRPKWSLWSRFWGTTLPDRLIREAPDLNVQVLSSQKRSGRATSWKRLPSMPGSFKAYVAILGVLAGVTVLNLVLVPLLGYKSVGYVFLISVMGIGFFASLGPILFAAILSAFLWDILFTPPVGMISIHSSEDAILILLYFFSALITGTLMFRIRRRERMLLIREERTLTQTRMMKTMATAPTREACLLSVSEALGSLLKGKITFFYKTIDGDFSGLETLFDKESAVFSWVVTHQKSAGWSTETLPEAAALYIPLLGSSGLVGVMSFQGRIRLLQEEETLLYSMVQQMTIYLERERFRERSIIDHQIQHSERLYQVLLDCVSHEIKTPITAILGMASMLQDNRANLTETQYTGLVEELMTSSDRLNQVVDNLLDMSRINSGNLRLKLSWQDPGDIVRVCLQKHRVALAAHHIVPQFLEDAPLINVDFSLIEHALSNVVLNAAFYSPPHSEIKVSILRLDQAVIFQVSDQGPGIPAVDRERVFDKFYRMAGTQAGGTGLGLTITKTVMELHGGHSVIGESADGGAQVQLILPIEHQPAMPQEVLP